MNKLTQSKQSKTIRTILEQVFAYGADTLSDVDKPDREQAYENQKKNGIDQALSDISKIINEAKPDFIKENEYSGDIMNLACDVYQCKIKELIK
jgi:hypothetical protein